MINAEGHSCNGCAHFINGDDIDCAVKSIVFYKACLMPHYVTVTGKRLYCKERITK